MQNHQTKARRAERELAGYADNRAGWVLLMMVVSAVGLGYLAFGPGRPTPAIAAPATATSPAR